MGVAVAVEGLSGFMMATVPSTAFAARRSEPSGVSASQTICRCPARDGGVIEARKVSLEKREYVNVIACVQVKLLAGRIVQHEVKHIRRGKLLHILGIVKAAQQLSLFQAGDRVERWRLSAPGAPGRTVTRTCRRFSRKRIPDRIFGGEQYILSDLRCLTADLHLCSGVRDVRGVAEPKDIRGHAAGRRCGKSLEKAQKQRHR